MIYLVYLTLMKALEIYIWIIIASVAATWMVAFNVINTRHPWAAKGLKILNLLTEPVFKRIRQVIPPMGGWDLSPVIVVLGITMIRQLLTYSLIKLMS